MATICRYLQGVFTEYVEKRADPRVGYLPFMNSPLWMVLIVIVYLYSVNQWLPQLMKNRKPYHLKSFMIGYNIFQIAINLFLLEEGIRLFIKLKYSFICEPVDYSDNPDAVWLTKLIWVYFMVKVLDMADTIVMVLRKKQNQVSFLHVYHHAGMVVVTWITTKYFAGGHSTLVGILNCFVHAVMYSYYLFSAICPEYKGSLWWKRHLTELQMIQFIYMTIHCALSTFNPNCSFHKPLTIVFMIQNGFMFAMFLDFYVRTYLKKKK